MVRRVRLGRRDRPRPALRWAGPPPLLLVATAAALVVTPFVSSDPQPPAQIATSAAVTTTSPRVVEPRTLHPQHAPPGQGGRAEKGVAPVRLKPVDVGVASLNMFRKLSSEHAHADALRLTRRPGVDVVGWQEANRFAGVLHHLPGWRTRTFPFGEKQSELAVSWRASEFQLVAAHQRQVALGVGWREGRYPFGNRLVVTVTLRHRDTGRLLTVVDAHLPQKIEDLGRPGHWTDTINAFRARNELQRIGAIWKNAAGRWVLGTGDFNFDARADHREHPAGGPIRALGPTAVSSYQKLGLDVAPTYPGNGRNIDYVWADRKAYAAGRIRFDGQWVIAGFHSDHNALLTRLTLS